MPKSGKMQGIILYKKRGEVITILFITTKNVNSPCKNEILYIWILHFTANAHIIDQK